MNTKKDKIDANQPLASEDGETIEWALQQMEVLYKSRCVQAPFGSNITIREVKKEESSE